MAYVYTRLFEELPPVHLLPFEIDNVRTLFRKTLTSTDINSKLVIVGRNKDFFDQELQHRKPRVTKLSYPASIMVVDETGDGVMALDRVQVNRENSQGNPYIKWKDFLTENNLEFEIGQSIRVWYHWQPRVLGPNETDEDEDDENDEDREDDEDEDDENDEEEEEEEDNDDDDEEENDEDNEERVVNLLTIIIQRFQPPPRV